MKVVAWRTRMARSLPFYYGWVIVANTVSVSLSTRTVMAVAMLSVFVVPMTKELDWSRGLFSGAVSLGGLCAVVTSPFVGRWLDRFALDYCWRVPRRSPACWPSDRRSSPAPWPSTPFTCRAE